MTRIRRGRHVLATLLAIATIAVVAANPAIAGAAVTAPPPPAGAALPADWPSDVPVPPGELQGSTGGDGLWSVQLLVNGSAAQVLQSALDFYGAAGYATVATGVLLRGTHRLTLVTENRDHSNAHTFLVIGLEEVPAPPGAPAPAAPAPPATAPTAAALAPTLLPGPKSVRLSRARRSGLRVRFIAPAGARRAVVRAFRVRRGGRRLAGSAGAAVHGKRTTVRLRSAAFRRHVAVGAYVLELVLRGAGGAAGRPVTTRVRVVR